MGTYRVTRKPQTGWKGPPPDLDSLGDVRSEPLSMDMLRALMPEQPAQTQWADKVIPENKNRQEGRRTVYRDQGCTMKKTVRSMRKRECQY